MRFSNLRFSQGVIIAVLFYFYPTIQVWAEKYIDPEHASQGIQVSKSVKTTFTYARAIIIIIVFIAVTT